MKLLYYTVYKMQVP